MRIVVVGAGAIGRYLARLLSEEGNQVVIIDRDEALCKEIAAELDALVIHGDVTKHEAFDDAEISKADVMIAVTHQDALNLLACLIAKEHGIHRVIARVTDAELIKVFERLGIEKAICPEVEAANVIKSLITGRFGIVELITTSSGDLKLLDVTVSGASEAVDKRLIDLPLPRGCSVLALYSGKEFIVPLVDTPLHEGDRVILIAKAEASEEVERLFTG